MKKDMRARMLFNSRSIKKEKAMAGWTPVSERQPPETDFQYELETFIAYSEQNPDRGSFPCIRSGETYYNLEMVDQDGNYAEVDLAVTHWQPMPTPPSPTA